MADARWRRWESGEWAANSARGERSIRKTNRCLGWRGSQRDDDDDGELEMRYERVSQQLEARDAQRS